MSSEQHIHIKQLISQGKLGKAMAMFIQFFNNNKAILLAHRFNFTKELFSSGLITLEKYMVLNSRIAANLLSHIEGKTDKLSQLKSFKKKYFPILYPV